MQICIHLPPPPASFLSLPSTKPSSFLSYSPPIAKRQLGQTSIKAAASDNNSQVDYSSMASSVFPAEACETVGGAACDVEMFPETKIKQQSSPCKATPPPASQPLDTDYLDYNTPKTVFIAEACDDLGGEFCEPAYQSGVN